MKRAMFGIVLLAGATALWSCNGDPTDSIRNEPPKVLADPNTVVVNAGAGKFVIVELVDGQGNQLDAQFTPQNVGPEITVAEDLTYLQTSAGRITTSSRFLISGVSAGTTAFDLMSDQGPSARITVTVTDVPLAGTEDPSTAPSVPAPAAGQTTALIDAPDMTTAPDRFYKLDVPEDGNYTITLFWTTGSDLDLFVCPAAGVATFDCDFTAATGNKPESATFSLTTGTYFLVAEDFGGDAGTTSIKLTVTH